MGKLTELRNPEMHYTLHDIYRFHIYTIYKIIIMYIVYIEYL